MSTPTTEPGTYSLHKGWRTLAIAGGVVALLGLLAILLPLATGIAIAFLVGALLVVGGIVHAGHAFTARGWRGSLWQLALAVVSVGAGLLLLVNPVVGLLSLTILVVAYLLVDGIAELGMSLRMSEEPGRAWIAASGVLSLVLAGLLWAGFPGTAAWAIGLLVGISLLTTGLSMVAVAYGGRRLEDDVAPPATEPRGA
ncbi:HdeD family acid-resistance protein [Natronococcus sp. A-GB7]|uniref:HdeD family acid-resistance protein n=1 Tax=Natronococcus sp. A-GB7 TaxID=3037649 RepID=UPI00241D114F|nr:HdeD family acid-resistance protein [Natronococcus sp. A-GB7]MDG5817518.1 HdeD family acid-resistance protein [Natronococcus sp. A-GB7]